MKDANSKNGKESKEKKPEYVVKVNYGGEALETCIRKTIKAMIMKAAQDAEKI